MVRVILLVAIFGIQYMIGLVLSEDGGQLIDRTTVSLGFVILTGYVFGQVMEKISLPKITGYLFSGLVCGPSLLGLLDLDVVIQLRAVDELALCLIAFTAGGELRLDTLKKSFKTVLSISIFQTVLTFLAVTTLVYTFRRYVPFISEIEPLKALSISSLFGLIASANSPSTAIAVIIECKSQGRVTDTVLGGTIVKDTLIILGFTVLISLISPILANGEGTQAGLSIVAVMYELPASLVAGIIIGFIILFVFNRIQKNYVFFILAIAILIMSISRELHLSNLLVSIGAGFVLSNYSPRGQVFFKNMEKASLPVFVVFFCISGAALDIEAFFKFWMFAIAFVLVRSLFTYAGTYLGAKLNGEKKEILHYSWLGFIGQAGVSLGFSGLICATFPDWGPQFHAIIVGAIVVNQIIGPIGFQYALVAVGEKGCEPAENDN